MKIPAEFGNQTPSDGLEVEADLESTIAITL